MEVGRPMPELSSQGIRKTRIKRDMRMAHAPPPGVRAFRTEIKAASVVRTQR